MSASALQMNWTSVQFASTNLTRVTAVTFSQGGELIEFAGDNNRYPVVIANNMNRPRCSITSGDVATLMAIAPGTSGTITATQNDALAAAGGAINWTMSNAVHQNTDDTGRWGHFATATATFRAYSTDGVTPPLSITSRT
jgi:hypothetical protein